MKPSQTGVWTIAGATALTRIRASASPSRGARERVEAGLGHRHADEGVALMAGCAHIDPTFDRAAALAHVPDRGLGDEIAIDSASDTGQSLPRGP